MSTENKRVSEPDTAKEEKNNYIRVVQAEEDDKEIDLVDLGYALMDKLHFIVLSFLLGAVLLNAYAYFLIKPTYQSTAKLYVVSANTLAEISVKYLPETMSTNAPNIAQVARIPDEKAGPSYLKFTLIGALLGAFLYCLVIIIRYLLDDTIHTASDMEKYFGIVPLTSIPESDQFNQGDSATDKEKAKSGLKGRSK